jgi:hypothetical protein
MHRSTGIAMSGLYPRYSLDNSCAALTFSMQLETEGGAAMLRNANINQLAVAAHPAGFKFCTA